MGKKKVLINAMGVATPNKGLYRDGTGRSNVSLLREFEKINDPDIEFEIYSQHPKVPQYRGGGMEI